MSSLMAMLATSLFPFIEMAAITPRKKDLFLLFPFLFLETQSLSCEEGSAEKDHLGQWRVCGGGNFSDRRRVKRERRGMLPRERWNEFLVLYVTLPTIFSDIVVSLTSCNYQRYVHTI